MRIVNELQHCELRGTLEMDNDVYTTIDDLLDGFKEAKLSRAKAHAIIERIEAISGKASLMRSDTQVLLANNFVFSQTTFYLLLGTMVFVVPMLTSGYSDVVQKSTTAVLFIIGPISGLIGSIPIFENASAAAESVMDLEERLKRLSGNEGTEPPEELDAASRPSAFSAFKTLELREAVFRYQAPGGDPTDSFSIGPINLTIERGEVLFITGGNGSGKSTLLRVLTGLYPLDTGRILVDGKSVRPHQRQDYRELFAAVFGDFHLSPPRRPQRRPERVPQPLPRQARCRPAPCPTARRRSLSARPPARSPLSPTCSIRHRWRVRPRSPPPAPPSTTR